MYKIKTVKLNLSEKYHKSKKDIIIDSIPKSNIRKYAKYNINEFQKKEVSIKKM